MYVYIYDTHAELLILIVLCVYSVGAALSPQGLEYGYKSPKKASSSTTG